MNKTLGRLLGLASLVTIVAVGLAACGNGPVATAQQQPASVTINSNQQGIWVNGEGKVTVAPDTAVLDLGVSAQASTVAQAQAQASTAMDKVMAALTSNGVDKKDIQTQYFSIQQSYLPTRFQHCHRAPLTGRVLAHRPLHRFLSDQRWGRQVTRSATR